MHIIMHISMHNMHMIMLIIMPIAYCYAHNYACDCDMLIIIAKIMHIILTGQLLSLL